MNIFEILKNMGFRYVAYRAWYEFRRKSGLLKRSFPVRTQIFSPQSLESWRKEAQPFFFDNQNDIQSFEIGNEARRALAEDAQKIFSGSIRFFNGEWIDLGKEYDWVTNPKSGFRYEKNTHWTKIEEFQDGQGDIKYVWEKSRFSYLYAIIRHDKQNNSDSSEFVIKEIDSWIAANPVNCGPNFKCSQEISLRVLNWIFALFFYRNSKYLDSSSFQLIQDSIYWQMKHVEDNLNFSLYTVRNNHAVTESLALFSVGLLFPCFSEAKRWKEKGKKNLIGEGLHQIYKDGAYLQHSFNYHRVVVQLYTWALGLARKNNETFPEELLKRLQVTVEFLYQHQESENGQLPNYGANDGSLFFPLNSCDFADYRPQLNALHSLLNNSLLYDSGLWSEDETWFLGRNHTKTNDSLEHQQKRMTSSFSNGGYYVLRDHTKFAFVRCCSFAHRPVHADNLHVDLWYNGHNIVRDCGSYRYNTTTDLQSYFSGTKAHNTVMLDGYDQMEKGPRFIWYKWSNALNAQIIEKDDYTEFHGVVNVFKQVSPGVMHSRIIRQYKKTVKWEVIDEIKGWNGESKQIWNISPDFYNLGLSIVAMDKNGSRQNAIMTRAWYSPTYGLKENAEQLVFKMNSAYCKTVIQEGNY